MQSVSKQYHSLKNSLEVTKFADQIIKISRYGKLISFNIFLREEIVMQENSG